MARPRSEGGWRQVLERHENGAATADPGFWEQTLRQRPDVLHRFLADVHRSVHGTTRPPTLDELWSLVAEPVFSADPFPVAFETARGTRSMAQIATYAGMHRATLKRYVDEERPIVSTQDPGGSMHRLEVVAKALGVHPSYFSEWRRLWVMSLIDVAFTDRPELSVSLYRRFSTVPSRVNGRSDG